MIVYDETNQTMIGEIQFVLLMVNYNRPLLYECAKHKFYKGF